MRVGIITLGGITDTGLEKVWNAAMMMGAGEVMYTRDRLPQQKRRWLDERGAIGVEFVTDSDVDAYVLFAKDESILEFESVMEWRKLRAGEGKPVMVVMEGS